MTISLRVCAGLSPSRGTVTSTASRRAVSQSEAGTPTIACASGRASPPPRTSSAPSNADGSSGEP
eukprot:400618-Alexandrium_andersonii.AAC.1